MRSHERVVSSYEIIAANDLNYLFWQYENYLRRTEYLESKPIGFRQFKGLSIEYIISQVRRKNPAGADEHFSNTDIHNIGNLTLDLSYENSAKSNREFDEKYKYFYQNSIFRCQQELISFTNPDTNEWDKISLGKRQNKIVNFAMMYWDYKTI